MIENNKNLKCFNCKFVLIAIFGRNPTKKECEECGLKKNGKNSF